jgi:hypothetical protein
MDGGDGGRDGHRCSCHSHQGIHRFSLVSLYRECVESLYGKEKEVPGVKTASCLGMIPDVKLRKTCRKLVYLGEERARARV